MGRKGLVKFAGNMTKFWKAGPRDGRKVVVLVVQTYVVGEEVQGTVIGVCFYRCCPGRSSILWRWWVFLKDVLNGRQIK